MHEKMDQQILMPMIKSFMKFMIIIQSISIATACYTSIIGFGNSLTDTGNLLHILSPDNLPPSAFPPYGNTYFHHPTGRFSDGRLIIDFIAQYLGLPLVPPYFGAKEEDLKKGVNFAVAGATAINHTFLEEKGLYNPCANISLEVQVALFRQLLPRLCSTTPSCREFLGSSLVLMGEIGGNDYIYAFLSGFSLNAVKEFVPVVVSTIGSAIKEVIELGAKTILVPGFVPIGCTPSFLQYFNTTSKEDYDPFTGCINWLNNFSQYHNMLLQNQLSHIRALHPNVRIIYADYYNALLRLYQSPRQFGFDEINALKSCCLRAEGTNNNNGSQPITCGIVIASCCDDPSSYISWDRSHFTEAAYRWVAMGVLEGPFSYPPFRSTLCGGATLVSSL